MGDLKGLKQGQVLVSDAHQAQILIATEIITKLSTSLGERVIDRHQRPLPWPTVRYGLSLKKGVSRARIQSITKVILL